MTPSENDARHARAALAVAVVATTLATPGGLLAQPPDHFDETTGRVVTDGAVFAFGFELDETGEFGPFLDPGGPFAIEERYEDGARLEGEGSLALLAGEMPFLNLGEAGVDLGGRRVEMRVWYRSEGTDLVGVLQWAVPGHALGQLLLTPTGRATSDGWIEVTSGPFDWALGSVLAPTFLTFVDGFFEERNPIFPLQQTYQPRGDERVLIDAFTIDDLGPALVPEGSCTILNEDDVCGADGLCWVGRCVDPASVFLGRPQPPAWRLAVLERAKYINRHMAGSRTRDAATPEFEAALDALVDASMRDWWPGLLRAWELLVDGHSRPPGIFPVGPPSLPLCLSPGVADMLPGAPEVPLVTSEGLAPGGLGLALGDALVAIDGVAPSAWLQAASDFTFYTGDPANREHALMGELQRLVAGGGAELTFERCPMSSGDPCSADQVETLVLDLAAELGTLYESGALPAWWDTRDAFCDGLFDRFIEGDPFPAQPLRERVAYRDEGDVRTVQFYGFPFGQAWFDAMAEALDLPPGQKLIIDQRLGQGGSVIGVEHVTERVMTMGHDLRTILAPRMSLEGGRVAELEACLDREPLQSLYCGNAYSVDMQRIDNGLGTSAPIALISGRSVSGNDYLAAALSRRQAPVRFLGLGPTWGAFGHVCMMPPLMGLVQPSAFQCADTFFVEDGVLPDPGAIPWMSGTGIGPDEVVLQLQSDAVLGVDTHHRVAKEWLSTQ